MKTPPNATRNGPGVPEVHALYSFGFVELTVGMEFMSFIVVNIPIVVTFRSP